MKKMILLLSVVAVAFALQAGEGTCPKDKANCDKAKTDCPAKAEAKGCCPGKKGEVAKETAKKPVQSPKQGGAS